jgi:tetratricopeptide (TPR) repeat protein
LAGKKVSFEETLRDGFNSGWEDRWQEAVLQFHRAVADFPNEPMAHSSLGLAYSMLGRYAEAAAEYKKAAGLAAGDLFSLAQLANLQESLGQPVAAAASQAALADAYYRQGWASLALGAWEKAVQLDPQNPSLRCTMGRAYGEAGQLQDAVAELLAASRLYQGQGDLDQAMEACQEAVALDTACQEARSMLETLRWEKSQVAAPAALGPEVPAAVRGPAVVEAAGQEALARLAEALLEAPPEVPPLETAAAPEEAKALQRIQAVIRQAVDYQAQGRVKEAIEAYQEALGLGAGQVELRYNLGLLYQQAGQLAQAAEQLAESALDPAYAAPSLYALGQCQQGLSQFGPAFASYARALELAFLGAESPHQPGALAEVYVGLADYYLSRGDRQRLLEMATRVGSALALAEQEDKVAQARQRLGGWPPDLMSLGLAQALELTDPDGAMAALIANREYRRDRLFLAAIGECYDAIQRLPGYLPAHHWLLETLVEAGRVEEAVEKSLTLADTYAVRGDNAQAARFCRRALELDNTYFAAATKLADLLVQEGKKDEAVSLLDSLGERLLDRGSTAGAIRAIEKIITLAPESADGYRELLSQLKQGVQG